VDRPVVHHQASAEIFLEDRLAEVVLPGAVRLLLPDGILAAAVRRGDLDIRPDPGRDEMADAGLAVRPILALLVDAALPEESADELRRVLRAAYPANLLQLDVARMARLADQSVADAKVRRDAGRSVRGPQDEELFPAARWLALPRGARAPLELPEVAQLALKLERRSLLLVRPTRPDGPEAESAVSRQVCRELADAILLLLEALPRAVLPWPGERGLVVLKPGQALRRGERPALAWLSWLPRRLLLPQLAVGSACARGPRARRQSSSSAFSFP
jgi:hypothetical protein